MNNSMSESKTYNTGEMPSSKVNDAAVAYATTNSVGVESFVSSLPHDMMNKFVDYAVTMHRSGRCIPNSQIDELLDRRLGWK